MKRLRQGLVVSMGTVCLAGCVLHDTYPPALPEDRVVFDNSAPFVPVTPPESETNLKCPTSSGLPVITQEEWDKLTRVDQPPGKRGKKKTTELSMDNAMQRLPYREGQVYQIKTSPQSATYLMGPTGDRLASAPALNTNKEDPHAWAVGVAEQGLGLERREIIIVRPLLSGHATTVALLWRSGLVIFVRLIATDKAAALSVSWDVPIPRGTIKEDIRPERRPPQMNVQRLHTAYRVEVVGKVAPAWLPQTVFDDGTKTIIKFQEALTFTRAPMVTGLTQHGKGALVQAQMYVTPGAPEKGAWLLINGLWPAMELQDSAGLLVRIMRVPTESQPWKKAE